MIQLVDEMIRNFSRQELREFRYFLSAGDSEPGKRADIKLAESIRNGENTQKPNDNANHQTRKRLKKKLEQFAMLENMRLDPFSGIYTMMETAKYLFRKNMHQQGWEYLFKAEMASIEREEYRLLDYNYELQMIYSYNIGSPPPKYFALEDLVKKWESNRRLALADSNTSTAYAVFIHELRQQFSKQLTTDIDKLAERILKTYGVDDKVYDDKLRIYCKIVHLVCRTLREKRNYNGLKNYAIKSYKKLEKWKALDKITPDDLIDLLDHICVATLRSKDYTKCEKYTRLYEQHAVKMIATQGEYSYYDFIPAVGVCDICLCTNRLEEARKSLLIAQKKYRNYTTSVRIYFLLRINLLAVHFSAGEYDKCIRLYNEIKIIRDSQILNEPGFRVELILFSDIYSIIFHYEDGEDEYALYLLNKTKRKHHHLLIQQDSKREMSFITILEKILTKPGYLLSERFQADAKKLIAMKEFIAGDFEYISMNAWLLSKLNSKPYYDCFLELVK
jgi:hypothetical protein